MGNSKSTEGGRRSSFNWDRHVNIIWHHQHRVCFQHHQVHFDEYVHRMMRFLLSKSTLEVSLQRTTSFFTSNRAHKILLSIYLEDALWSARAKVTQNNPQIEHSYFKVKRVYLSGEMIYAEGTDILSTDQRQKARVLNAICEVFPERSLQINADKIERTILKREKKKAELSREVKKLGSLLGDKEDITRWKQLSIAAMNNIEKIWIRKDHTSEKHPLKLYRTLVKPVLLYNSATWGMIKQGTPNLTHSTDKSLGE